VVAVDPVAERVALARRLGAVHGVLLGVDNPEQIMAEASGGQGADALVVAAAAGDARPVELAAALARDRATVCVIGDVELQLSRAAFYEKELTLRVSRSYGPGRHDPSYEREGHDYPIGYVRWTERRLIAHFLEELAAGRVRARELVTHEFPIEQGELAYRALGDPGRLAILLRYPETPRPGVERVVAAGRPPTGRTRGLRVGLVGPGMFARSTLLPLLRDSGVELVAVAGGAPARALAAARHFGAGWVVGDVEALLDDEAVDALVVTTRHGSHAELAARALERGKGVLVEKPLSVDRAGLERVRPLLAAGGRLVVDFNRSLSPAARAIAAHFSGRGEPLALQYRVNAGFLAADHWLRDHQEGGGRVVGECCHFVDFCSAVVGQPAISVQATTLGPGPRTLPGDNVLLVVRYADGSMANILYVASAPRRLAKERLEVLGAGRAAVVDDFRHIELLPRAGRRGVRSPVPRRDKGHRDLVQAALRFLEGGGNPPVPYDRMLETTEITLAARDALARGEAGPVPLSAT
jgi:predicted dehydrogenase